jgi:uncharacterized SAM-binding protein YcdF (DUF218 family)
MIYLHRILPLLVLPVGVTLILLLAGLVLRRWRYIGAAILVLWCSSTPIVGALLMRAAEGWTERTDASAAPAAHAIVVLSTGRVAAPGAGGISEWGDADRFYGGVDLFQKGKAPLLVFTGGWLPWEPHAATEGDVLATYAKAMGVPSAQIVTTGRVSNTAEEAEAVAEVLRERRQPSAHILLVTSAFHMHRAERLFARTGLSVSPYVVDFQVSDRRSTTVMDFLPTAGALGQTQAALREIYGRLYYRLF